MKGPRRILVASHDAGGAEIVSAWVKNHQEYAYTYLLEGPAAGIFLAKIPGLDLVPRKAVLNSTQAIDLVLTGTGWGSDLEKELIAWAKSRGIRTAAYIDHWVNYRERFILQGNLVLPDEIWVGDNYALDLAQTTFPGSQVRLEPNLYFQEIKDELRKAGPAPEPDRRKVRILYVCEPTSVMAEKKYGNPRHLGYTEFEALEGYLQYLLDRATIIDRIRLRLHPAEPQGKYRHIIAQYWQIYDLEESQRRPLVEDCAWADWIVGCQSMALVIGVLAQKQVFSCIPPGGAPLSLPFPEIVRLFID
jgi:hypothetical protein